MTISSSYSPDTYSGDGSTTSFAITFGFLSVDSNVKVTVKNTTTGALTAKTNPTHYSISGTNVVFGTAPTSSEQVIIELNPDFTQDTDYAENSALSSTTLETDFDERTLEAQRNGNLADNSLKLDPVLAASVDTTIVATTTANAANKYIQFDSNGTGFQLSAGSAGGDLWSDVVDADIIPDADGTRDLGSSTYRFAETHTDTLEIAGTTSVTAILDEDNMASDSATSLATQQSIKAYVDANSGGLSNVVEDTTPQLGAMLDTNGYGIGDGTRELLTFTEDGSAVNHINIENQATGSGPIISAAGDDTNVDLNISAKGTGNITIGNYSFDADQTVGAGQDNYVLTYDNAGGLISLEAAPGGAGGDAWSDAVDADIIPDADGTRDLGSAATRFAETHTDTLEIAGSSVTGMTGADANIVTGTAGTSGNLAQWNGDGDAVDASIAASDVMRLGTAQEHTATHNFNATTLSDGATINWDASANQVCSVTLGGNRTMAAPTNLVDGGTYVLSVIQDGTGSRTITWNSVFKWPGGTAPTLSTGANARDIITFVSDGTNLYGTSALNFS